MDNTPHKPLILIVEDDTELSALFSEVLVMQGFNVEVARDGRVALEKLRELTPDMALLDMHLPHISGRDVLKQIETHNHLKAMKIIVLTADPLQTSDMEDRVDLILIKPITYQQIITLTQRMLPH
jgi:DNA-binding response OmpR family regulator